MRVRLMLCCAVAVAGAGLSLGGGLAFGYAGEQGTVGTGISPATVSTHHLHLTRALAYCAGFSGDTTIENPVNPLITRGKAGEAEIIGIYDELTDQGTITDGTTVWTNITPGTEWTYKDKTAADFNCQVTRMVYPLTPETAPPNLPDDSVWNPNVGWFTNRFGPWAVEFHFPNENDLVNLKAFGLNSGVTLSARTVYAFGTSEQNMWSADCYSPEYQTAMVPGIIGSLASGTHEALAIYLHSLGDSYSHGMCSSVYPSGHDPEWVYHTQAGSAGHVENCAFNSHSLEFGCPSTSTEADFEKNVVTGGIEIFKVLLQYGGTHGKTARLKSPTAHQQWLRRQLERYTTLFLTNTNSAGGRCRVSFAWELMKACDVAAQTPETACLNDVQPTCDSSGYVEACTPHAGFPMTPACTPPATTATR